MNYDSKKHTTVVLSPQVEKIKQELMSVYGLKNVISAGLSLFSKLDANEQKRLIFQINHSEPMDKKKILTDAIENIKILNTSLERPGTVIEILNTDEQELINQLKSLLAPDDPPTQKKKTGG